MKNWIFSEVGNGLEVQEAELNYDLHCFNVYNGDRYIGCIQPNTIKDMENCINELNEGYDPISNNWEDGNGNLCVIEGWGDGLRTVKIGDIYQDEEGIWKVIFIDSFYETADVEQIQDENINCGKVFEVPISEISYYLNKEE